MLGFILWCLELFNDQQEKCHLNNCIEDETAPMDY